MYIHSTDQLGTQHNISFPPQRIVSLVPSQTELLFDLGLDERILAVTRFCVHPKDKVSEKIEIGGTKRFEIDFIGALKPDLIIGNKEENYEEGIEALRAFAPVWMSDIFTLSDAISMIKEVGRITGTDSKADLLANEITSRLTMPAPTGKTCAYFIWRRPYMVAAQNTFIDYMLGVFGVQNVFNDLQRYPEVSIQDISAANPDYIFLSSEPYAFNNKHIPEFNEMCPNARVIVVDGEMFSWYGSRLRLAADYFSTLRQQLGIAS